MGKQYELKWCLKLSQNGHKICYLSSRHFGDGVHNSKGTVGREAGKTYIFLSVIINLTHCQMSHHTPFLSKKTNSSPFTMLAYILQKSMFVVVPPPFFPFCVMNLYI